MDKLQLPHAKLFYYAAELFKKGQVNENEKIKLKGKRSATCFNDFLKYYQELVINDDPRIFEFLERYQKNGNEKDFVNDLLFLLGRADRSSREQPPPQAPAAAPTQQLIVLEKERPNSKFNNSQTLTDAVEANKELENYNQVLEDPETQERRAEYITQNPNVPDEISSPLGLQLLKRKKRQVKVPAKEDLFKPFVETNSNV